MTNRADTHTNAIAERNRVRRPNVDRDRYSDPGLRRRPRLLVSVRSIAEFETVVKYRPDLIDLKEPRNGSLAATSPALWHSIAGHTATGCQGNELSIALGDGHDGASLADAVPRQAMYAKLGFANCRTLAVVGEIYQTFRSALPSPVHAVAVAYADQEVAGCPSPDEFIAAADSIGFQHLLIDTFGKNDRWWNLRGDEPRWQRYVRSARESGLSIAMAGRLTLEDLQTIVSNDVAVPDIVGVRSAVCDGDRTDTVSSRLLRAAVAIMRDPKTEIVR